MTRVACRSCFQAYDDEAHPFARCQSCEPHETLPVWVPSLMVAAVVGLIAWAVIR